MSWVEPYFRVQTLDLLRGIMSGLKPRGLEKGGNAKHTKMVKEGCMEEAELERKKRV